jgi:hypothetical protein
LFLYAGLAVVFALGLFTSFAYYRGASTPGAEPVDETDVMKPPPADETIADKPSEPPPVIVYPIESPESESPESEPPAADEEEPETAPSEKSAGRTGRSTKKKARARLRVGVFPWGKVWIDGRERGTSPIEIDIAAGKHTIAGGRERPTKTKTVTLKPGARKEVVIDL